MKITIIGVGALGSLFACRLSSLADVILLGNWPEQIAAIQQGGLQLIHTDGRMSQHAVTATSEPAEAKQADLALVLVKCWQTDRAAQQAALLLSQGGIALTLQNGIGNLETIAAAVGRERAALGVTSEGALMESPGIVQHAGAGLTHLAATPPVTQAVERVAALFQRAAFNTHVVDSADSLVWGKLAINAGINPLTALLQVPNGFLAQNAVAQSLMGQAAEEAALVACAQGIQLPYDDARQRACEVAKATAANRSSMAQDVIRGTPTEIEHITGAIVRLGRELGVQTPVNAVLLHLVRCQLDTGDWRSHVAELPSELQMLAAELASLEVGP